MNYFRWKGLLDYPSSCPAICAPAACGNEFPKFCTNSIKRTLDNSIHIYCYFMWHSQQRGRYTRCNYTFTFSYTQHVIRWINEIPRGNIAMHFGEYFYLQHKTVAFTVFHLYNIYIYIYIVPHLCTSSILGTKITGRNAGVTVLIMWP